MAIILCRTLWRFDLLFDKHRGSVTAQRLVDLHRERSSSSPFVSCINQNVGNRQLVHSTSTGTDCLQHDPRQLVNVACRRQSNPIQRRADWLHLSLHSHFDCHSHHLVQSGRHPHARHNGHHAAYSLGSSCRLLLSSPTPAGIRTLVRVLPVIIRIILWAGPQPTLMLLGTVQSSSSTCWASRKRSSTES